MAAGDEYTTGGGGRLKIKGVQDGRIGKKKKKKTTKSKKTEDENENKEKIEEKGGDVNKDVDAAMKEGGEKGKGDEDMVEKRKKEEGEGGDDHAESLPKTKAEIEYEERRKKRVCMLRILETEKGMLDCSHQP